MSQVYYTLEQAAEVLKISPGEVNRMREQNQIRAFRDGSNWKFRKEDVDKSLTDLMRKENQEHDEVNFGEDADDVLTFGLGGDDEDLPTLMADTAESAVHSAVVGAVHDSVESSLNLAKKTAANAVQNVADHVHDALTLDKNEDSELSLADNDDDLNIGLSSDVHQLAGEPGPELEIAHDEDDLVLGGGSDLDLTGGSGLTLAGEDDDSVGLGLAADDELELDEDSDILAIAGTGEDSDSVAFHVEPEEDTDVSDVGFDLVSAEDDDEPDSSSQVISLDKADDSFIDEPMFSDSDMSGFGDVDVGPGPTDAFAGPDMTSAPVHAGPVGPLPYQANYSGGGVIAMGVCILLLSLGGMMLFDLVRNIWSWDQPFVLTSSLMNMIAGGK